MWSFPLSAVAQLTICFQQIIAELAPTQFEPSTLVFQGAGHPVSMPYFELIKGQIIAVKRLRS